MGNQLNTATPIDETNETTVIAVPPHYIKLASPFKCSSVFYYDSITNVIYENNVKSQLIAVSMDIDNTLRTHNPTICKSTELNGMSGFDRYMAEQQSQLQSLRFAKDKFIREYGLVELQHIDIYGGCSLYYDSKTDTVYLDEHSSPQLVEYYKDEWVRQKNNLPVKRHIVTNGMIPWHPYSN